jgi:enoyl-CoA hydratase/carnithine racemase
MSETFHTHDPDSRFERDDHIATVTIDPPRSKHAYTGNMWVALGARFGDLTWSGVRYPVPVITEVDGECVGAGLRLSPLEFKGR